MKQLLAPKPPDQIPHYKFSPVGADRPGNLGDPVAFLKARYGNPFSFGIEQLTGAGVYRFLGWEYNLRPWLRRYLVRHLDRWTEIWAPNKAAARRNAGVPVHELVEIPKPK